MMDKQTVFIYSWSESSKGAKGLKKALGIRSIRHKESSYEGRAGHTVINWGSSQLPAPVQRAGRIINPPNVVDLCSNKTAFFTTISKANKARIPDFTTNSSTALSWVKDGDLVVARTRIRSSSGDGIFFFDEKNIDDFLDAPLYTKYKKKKHEFRVHVAFGHVVDVQKKVLRREDDRGSAIDESKIDTRIRTHKNGYIFARVGITVPDDVITQAVNAANSIQGLDFGAVDVLFNEHEGHAYVLEINTAPGIEGSTLDNYAETFRNNI